MRLHLQRVKQARVEVDGATAGEIGRGLLVLVGFNSADAPDLPGSALWNKLIGKLLDLRIFPDDEGKLNRSLRDCGGEVLVVSQFTLYADCKKGRRPSFHLAAAGDIALGYYKQFVADLEEQLPGRVRQGVFGEMMDVSLVNWGPVTILLDSDDF